MLTAVAVGATIGWRNAVHAAAAPLVEVGATTPEYGRRCIESAEELDPYFVLSPGVALAHTRAEDICLRPGLSLLRLDKPAEFGHEVNDPVSLVFCLTSPDNETHVAGLRVFALTVSGDPAERLRGTVPDELIGLLAEASAA